MTDTMKPCNHELGYTKPFLKEWFAERGCVWENFTKWMRGQTTAIDNGETIYYYHDVLTYLTKGGLNAKVTD